MKLKYTEDFINNFYTESLKTGKSFRALCKEKNLSYSSIQKALKRYNIKQVDKYSDDLLSRAYFIHKEEQSSIAQVALKLNVDRTTLLNKLKAKKYRLNNYKSNGHFIYEDYFKRIDSENKSYILGLIYADGCISYSKGSPSLSINLHNKDKYIIEFISQQLGKNITIYSEVNNTQSSIKVHRPSIINDLINLGVQFNKSTKGSMRLPCISKELLPHFIRGFMDGDGTVSKKGHVCFYSTSRLFLEDLQSIFNELGCSKKVHIHSVKNTKTPYYHLHYARENSSNIIYPYLYSSCTICMERKKKRFIR